MTLLNKNVDENLWVVDFLSSLLRLERNSPSPPPLGYDSVVFSPMGVTAAAAAAATISAADAATAMRLL